MHISERNIQDTSGFIVADTIRNMRDAQTIAILDREYDAGNNALRGLSLLLVGCKEKQHVLNSLEKIKNERVRIFTKRVPDSELDFINSKLAGA